MRGWSAGTSSRHPSGTSPLPGSRPPSSPPTPSSSPCGSRGRAKAWNLRSAGRKPSPARPSPSPAARTRCARQTPAHFQARSLPAVQPWRGLPRRAPCGRRDHIARAQRQDHPRAQRRQQNHYSLAPVSIPLPPAGKERAAGSPPLARRCACRCKAPTSRPSSTSPTIAGCSGRTGPDAAPPCGSGYSGLCAARRVGARPRRPFSASFLRVDASRHRPDEVPLPAALAVVGWLFFLAWRGRDSFLRLVTLGATICCRSFLSCSPRLRWSSF